MKKAQTKPIYRKCGVKFAYNITNGSLVLFHELVICDLLVRLLVTLPFFGVAKASFAQTSIMCHLLREENVKKCFFLDLAKKKSV